MPVYTYYASPRPAAPPTQGQARPSASFSYSAASLSGLAGGAGVARWPNQGFEARPYDLYPSAGAATAGAYYPAAGGLPAYVRCQSDTIMQSLNSLPAELDGKQPRTLGIKFRVFSGNVNLAGYGNPGDTGRIFDLLAFQGGLLAPHYYGGQVTGPANAQEQFVTRAVRVSLLDNGLNRVEVLDGTGAVLTSADTDALNTYSGTVFCLLGGSYGAYNTTAVRDVAGCFLAVGALSTAVIQTELSYL